MTMASDRAAQQTAKDANAAADTLFALFERHRLSPVQRRIAQYLLSEPQEAIFLSSVQLADRTGVSQPSVTRFAKTLGFDGYPGLLRHVREHVRISQPRDQYSRGNKFQAAVSEEISHLEALRETLSETSSIEQVGWELAASEPLVVLGLRISAALARHFTYLASKIHPDVRLIAEGGSRAADQLQQAHAAGAACVLCFALPRYPSETAAVAELARELGLRVVTIAEQPLAPVRHVSDVLLHAGVGASLVFDSHAGPLMLATILVQAMSDAQPERTQRRLEADERLAQRQRFFDAG